MEILNLPLARSRVDRAAHLRADGAALESAWESARIIVFNGDSFLTDGGGIRYLTANEISGTGERIFLGQFDDENFFLWCSDQLHGDLDSHKTLRAISHQLSDLDVGLAVHAQAIAFWHHKTRHCVECGSLTKLSVGGSMRKCIENGHEIYPRTDPAIIVLTLDQSGRILLGRQRVWPDYRFSTFAGFVEAGESFEQAVAREVAEEAGVLVDEIKYLGSQPWPFPQSLMVAFQARIVDPENARPDGEEIEEVRWFDRESMIQALKDKTLLLPPSMSVSRAMINTWHGNNGEDLSAVE